MSTTACFSNPVVYTVIVGLVVVAYILATYGVVITIFYQRNKHSFQQLKEDVNGKYYK